MASPQARTAVAADRIKLIDEYDAGRIVLALIEEVAHPAGPHADKHLDEIGTCEVEERHPGFARHSPGQKGFAGSRGTQKQDTFGDAAAQLLKFPGVPEEVDYLLQFLLGFVGAGNVVEVDLNLAAGQQFRTALSEGEHPALPPLHLAHHEDPEEYQEDPREAGEQELQPGCRILLEGILDSLIRPPGEDLTVYQPLGEGDPEFGICTDAAAYLLGDGGTEFALNLCIGDHGDLYNLALVEIILEFGIGQFHLATGLAGHKLVPDHPDHDKDRPECQRPGGTGKSALRRLRTLIATRSIPPLPGPRRNRRNTVSLPIVGWPLIAHVSPRSSSSAAGRDPT